jgi:hypothetical protein
LSLVSLMPDVEAVVVVEEVVDIRDGKAREY